MKQNFSFKLLVIFCIFFFQSKRGFSQEQILWCGKVETEAYFKNGTDDWLSYLNKTINTTIPLVHCASPGKFYVEVRFLVERDGNLVNIKPLTKVGYGMEDEVVRAIRQAPNWIPATQNGKKCRAYKCTTYVFKVKENAGSVL